MRNSEFCKLPFRCYEAKRDDIALLCLELNLFLSLPPSNLIFYAYPPLSCRDKAKKLIYKVLVVFYSKVL